MTLPSTIAWICPICGYIHYGSEPPEECPVCGAGREVFEPYQEPAKERKEEKNTEKVIQWRCKDCGYIHSGDVPPESCPVCGQPADHFEKVEADINREPEIAFDQRFVIVGAGIAGVSAAESIRRNDPKSEIILISRESNLPYYRISLTRYLAGEIEKDQMLLHPADWYDSNKIDLRRGIEVTGIDIPRKYMILSNGESVSFDTLILATGSHPFIPPIPGADKANVITLRTMEDADFILKACQEGKRFVCIGGGLLGLEAAGALAKRGASVTVVENQPWLLPRHLNKEAAQLFQEQIKAMNINLKVGVQVKEIAGDSTVSGVMMDDGTFFPAEVVIVSAGVRSNIDLARESGIQVDKGIVVDSEMKTEHPAVFAAGDVVEVDGMLYGTWGPSQGQGTIAGLNASGRRADFSTLPPSHVLKVLGINLFSIGTVNPFPANSIVLNENRNGSYVCLVFQDQLLTGAVLMGDTSLSNTIKKTVEEKTSFPKDIIQPDRIHDLLDYLKKQGNLQV